MTVHTNIVQEIKVNNHVAPADIYVSVSVDGL